MMNHGAGRWICWAKMYVGKVFWMLSLISLLLAWTASANADGVICLKSRVNGACPSGGLPVAHLFLDSLALGLLALGSKGEMLCQEGMCKKEEASE